MAKVISKPVAQAKGRVTSVHAKKPTARLEARIPTEVQLMVKRAAEIQGRSITDFVTDTLQVVAQDVIERVQIIQLSMADQERFAEALLLTGQPAPALDRAFDRRNKLLDSE